jgi:hypothetical protein
MIALLLQLQQLEATSGADLEDSKWITRGWYRALGHQEVHQRLNGKKWTITFESPSSTYLCMCVFFSLTRLNCN